MNFKFVLNQKGFVNMLLPLITTGIGLWKGRKAKKGRESAEQRAQETALAERQLAERQAKEWRGRARTEADRILEAIIKATGLTPGERGREERMFGLEEKRLPFLEERAGRPGEELLRGAGPTGEALIDQVLAQVKDPGKFYESTLEPELELARQMINAEANKRGVFGGKPEGGIRFEMLGRAGIDLAIKSAREKMAARQEALSNAREILSMGLEEEQMSRSELADFLKSIQTLTTRGREREAKGVITGQELGAGFLREAERGGAGLMESAAGRAGDIESTFAGYELGRAGETERATREGLTGLLGDLFKRGVGRTKRTSETAETIGAEMGYPDTGYIKPRGTFRERLARITGR